MGERDDDVFGLSLSLSLGGCGGEVNQSAPQQSLPTNHFFQLKQVRSSDTRLFLRGSDTNSAAVAADCAADDDNGNSSPNSAVSIVSGKRCEKEEENAAAAGVELASCSRGSDEEDGGGGERKKLRLTKEQSVLLEETFKEHNTLNPRQKQALAKELNLRPRQVEVWFQNRRARTKLKQTEVDCEYLKRCCENLSEENRRLQKEVQELRALKLSPNLFMNMNPPTTLTMCPSCERVAVPSASSSSTANAPLALPTPSNCNLFGRNIWRPRPISRP